jgi:beta-galactosidase
MVGLTRRDLFKSSAAVTAASAMPAHAAHRRAKAHKPVAHTATPSVRERLLLDFGWRFHLGHACDQDKDFGFGLNQHTFAKAGTDVATAAALDFNDSAWTAVNLPHDWAVDLPFAPSKNPPPAGQDDPRAAHGFRPLGREYPETSVGWYRRVFDIPASDLGRRLSIEFDGVFRGALVMFNGYIVASHGDGYTPFRVDVSDFANYGSKNVLTVRVDASLGEGWFYEGAGIYRHVWLVKTDSLHIPQWGSWVRSEIAGSTAALTVSTELVNEGMTVRKCQVVTTVLDPKGRTVATLKTQPLTIGTLETRTLIQRATVHGPALWSLENPQPYQLVTKVYSDNKITDDAVVAFGIRSIRFDSEKGFFLNGKPVKLNGTCNHQDHAGVGAAVPDRLQYWRIEKLKEFGCNAYRSSHNPPAPELLDACDRLGMLVIDETRRMSSDEESLGDLARMIRRDRNHPSVILWSIGNEEQGQQGTERGARIAESMKRVCNELDPTRPITAAVDNPDNWGVGITPVLDVLGGNYRTNMIPAFHVQFPKKPMIGTETGSTVATRGVYVRDAASGYCAAYDTEFPWWASTAEGWLSVVGPRQFIAGGFVWTGFDYRGEPTPFNTWPNVASQFGIVDSCGFPKDNFFYYKAWWGKEPVLHLFPHWNWQGKEGQKINVWVHSNLDRVELFVNGQSQGVRVVEPYKHVEWDVAYAPGAIEARGYKGGKQVLVATRETTGAAAQIVLRTDRTAIDADGEDIAVVSVEIADAQGRVVPTADNPVTFRVSGPGVLIGVGNGDPRSHEPDKADNRLAFNGLCAAIVQAAKTQGEIRVEATSPGLQSGSLVVVATTAVKLRAAVE